ncbi:MAG TPA: DNA-binding protein [Methanotrichaceae archaeon]|nr:DNA-binding protein [Methanotrichaceae archaeon]
MKALLDTNALMVPEQFGVDIFSELARLGYIQCFVPMPVVRELSHLAGKAKGLDKIAARVGLALAGRCQVLDAEGNADEALINLAARENAAVFTNDRILKKRLFSKGITVVHLRQGRYLEIAGRSSDV